MPSLIDFNCRNFRLLLAAATIGKMTLLMMLIRPVVSSASTTIRSKNKMVTSSIAFLLPTMTSLSRRQGAALSTMTHHPRSTATKQWQAGLLAQPSMTVIRKQHFGSTTPTSTACAMSIADTPLGKSNAGALLLDGLEFFSVPANGDGHPLTVYGIQDKHEPPRLPSKDDTVVLMLHGRTWSSVPVYHLLGGPNQRAQGQESYSLMESLYYEANIIPYCVDFRGFGGTPHDATKGVEPMRCVEDTETVLQWIAKRHGMVPNDKDDDEDNNNQMKKNHSSDHMPALLGWSQGALVAQLTAQKISPPLSKLILYGSIYDAQLRYPRTPLYLSEDTAAAKSPIQNTFDGAIEDFTIEGTIPPKEAKSFADAALIADPIKCPWNHVYQFNNCDPARVHVPTLVVRCFLPVLYCNVPTSGCNGLNESVPSRFACIVT
jgi:pimeloyl-ACP methyl ester carboxylesterase